MRTKGSPNPHDVHSTQFLGEGRYGIVVKDNVYPGQQVTKIGKNDETISPHLFPQEYCLNIEANSPYITKAIAASNNI